MRTTQRPGTFKKGHKKFGGRQKGTPNRINSNLIERIVQAADQVGSDGKGKDGVDGYFQMLAGKKVAYFVGLLRQAVQKQVPATEPENEIVYATEQDFRQALLDRGIHPTLLPPPPRDPNEKPPPHLNLPKPPPGWELILRKKSESVEHDNEQPDPPTRSDLAAGESAELDKARPQPSEPDHLCPWPPIPGWRWEYNPYTRKWFAKPANSPRTIWIGEDFKV